MLRFNSLSVYTCTCVQVSWRPDSPVAPVTPPKVGYACVICAGRSVSIILLEVAKRASSPRATRKSIWLDEARQSVAHAA